MGNRWGEEEKKSKGLVGCGIAFFILALTSYTFYRNYQNLEGRRKLEAQMQDIIRTGLNKPEAQMISEILFAAEELGLDIGSEELELSKYLDDYRNPVVEVYIDFNFEVDVLVAKFPVSIPIAEKVTIVDL